MQEQVVTEIDLAALRAERLARLQTQMIARDVEAVLLFGEPNIRYATGATSMPVWSQSTFVRCALVPVEGRPVLFEHPNSIHRSLLATEADVRPCRTWDFFDDVDHHARIWAREMVAAMRALGATGDLLAIDRAGTPGFLALQAEGLTLTDSALVTTRAREIKTPQEVSLLRLNGGILVEMLTAFEAAIAPGITERELLAINASTLLKNGGEYLSTNTVCSGSNTNPWRAEATDRALEAGDLVFLDTDSVAVEGYFFCVSRTFPVGNAPTTAQRALYRDAHDWLAEMKELIVPGATTEELAAKAPKLDDRYMAQRYEVMFHSIGHEEDSPSLCYPDDVQSNPGRVIEENMALVVELYAGEVGARDGVKLGDQTLVTTNGLEVLAPYPFSEVLL